MAQIGFSSGGAQARLDFSRITDHLDRLKIVRKAKSDAEKKDEKSARDVEQSKAGTSKHTRGVDALLHEKRAFKTRDLCFPL